MNLFLNTLSEMSLYMTKQFVVSLVCLTGFLLISKHTFARAIAITFFTMPFSALLKSKLGAMPEIKKFALIFPSGHMQFATALYGYLFFEFKNIFAKVALGAILFLIAFALVYKGYHNVFDVIGGLAFGIFSIVIFKVITQKNDFNLIFFSCLSVIFSIYVYYLLGAKLNHLWISAGVLTGFSVGYLMNINYIRSEKSKGIIPLFICIAGFFILYLLHSVVKSLIKNAGLPLFFTDFIIFSFFAFHLTYASEAMAKTLKE